MCYQRSRILDPLALKQTRNHQIQIARELLLIVVLSLYLRRYVFLSLPPFRAHASPSFTHGTTAVRRADKYEIKFRNTECDTTIQIRVNSTSRSVILFRALIADICFSYRILLHLEIYSLSYPNNYYWCWLENYHSVEKGVRTIRKDNFLQSLSWLDK